MNSLTLVLAVLVCTLCKFLILKISVIAPLLNAEVFSIYYFIIITFFQHLGFRFTLPLKNVSDSHFIKTDRREGECYLEAISVRGNLGICHEPLGDPVTRSTCCCSIGKAWGPRCEVCPPEGSDEYEQLCPGGKGFRPNTITVRFVFTV